VRIETIREPALRVEVVRRNLEFERDPEAFQRRFAEATEAVRRSIPEARLRLAQIVLEDDLLVRVATACAELKVDGQRPDIVIVKTARAVAALHGQTQVTAEDLAISAEAALAHRTRDGGLLEPPGRDEIRDHFARVVKELPGRAPRPATSPTATVVTPPRADTLPRGGGAAESTSKKV
jgi:magnesium chelatase subunit D